MGDKTRVLTEKESHTFIEVHYYLNYLLKVDTEGEKSIFGPEPLTALKYIKQKNEIIKNKISSKLDERDFKSCSLNLYSSSSDEGGAFFDWRGPTQRIWYRAEVDVFCDGEKMISESFEFNVEEVPQREIVELHEIPKAFLRGPFIEKEFLLVTSQDRESPKSRDNERSATLIFLK